MAEIQSIKQRFGIITQSALLEQSLDTAIRVAPTDLTVLITGESGVGKEIFSKVIHSLSPRKHNPFIAINCGAIPEGTINSELFGHEKGAFTGATGDRKGYFETVNGGTIFLDEVGEMPLDTQSYLLRILESGEFIRVGSSQVQKTDVRVVAATHVDLRDKIRQGKFRDDLFYRLNTVPIQIPPLRDRREDIPVLFRKFSVDFAEKYRGLSIQLDEDAKRVLGSYRWPGNVRELKNVAEQLSVLTEQKMITAEDLRLVLPHLFQRHLPALTSSGSGESTTFQEREILYKLLFDMKNDLTDLKKVVFELIRNNNLEVTDVNHFRALETQGSESQTRDMITSSSYESKASLLRDEYDDEFYSEHRPVILDSHRQRQGVMEVVEENLSLESMEKDLIRKALQKHRGRRKEAADELGISERTLYRKIKQYDLQ
ncbi:MAG: sigma-54-dependent Fis family transcriptional regulator [Saprospiraceae bacterium]|nr:sigma-54-dependent Fis family transcriptional regulator [Saprospiraceae bacterium]